MCGHSPACPPCSAVHASASSGASTSPAIATAAHCHGPSGSSAEMRKCASRRGGACIPPAGATAVIAGASVVEADLVDQHAGLAARSEEHTSELQPLMRNSYAGFCVTK